MKKRSKTDRPAASGPFFEKQLSGEEPLSFATAGLLCGLAGDIRRWEPWEQLDESQLVFVSNPAWGEPCACSVMGALGEVLAVAAYVGHAGYQFFQKAHSGLTTSAGDFLAEQRSIFVDFVPRQELTRPDRDLLQAVGFPLNRGERAPVFRAVRPGYHPWYLTEGEGRMLAECLAAMVWICERLAEGPPPYWKRRGVYPLVSRHGAADGPPPHYSVQMVEAPRPTLTAPVPPPLDARRIEPILKGKTAPAGVLEVDQFSSAARIGQANERKACVRMALAVHGPSGFVFPPELARPETSTGEMLVDVVLGALGSVNWRPREIHVREPRHRVLLEPLAQALGCRLVVKASLPALDLAKDSLLAAMEGPDFFPGA